MTFASYWYYLVFLACCNMRAVGCRFHMNAVKAKVIPTSRKSYKINVVWIIDFCKLFVTVTLYGVLWFFLKRLPGNPHPFALQKFPSQHSEHVTVTSAGELLFLLTLHSYKKVNWHKSRNHPIQWNCLMG